METKRGIAEKSTDTLIVEHRLRSAEIGDVVSYAELSKLLGRDVREHCRGSIGTARKTLISESVFFSTISGEGLKRLNGEEAVNSSDSFVARARSATRRGLNLLRHVQFAELSEDAKQKHLATSSQLGAMHLFSSSKAARKIETRVKAAGTEIPIGETLKLFGG